MIDYAYSLATSALYLLCTLCVALIACWRRCTGNALAHGSRRWPGRGLLYGSLVVSFLARAISFAAMYPDLVCSSDVHLRNFGQALVVFFDAVGAACNWAAFTLLVLFLEEVRRATRHSLSLIHI